jgi:hypothetical protein
VSEQYPVSDESQEGRREEDSTERPAAEVFAADTESDTESDTEGSGDELGQVKDEGLSTLEGQIEEVKQKAREMDPEGQT